MLLRQQFLRLEDLLRVTHDSPAYNEGDTRGIFYAESWALVHYLLQSDKGQRLPQLVRFSQLLAAGQTLEDSFQQAFQTDFKTIEKSLRQYVQNTTYSVQVLTTTEPLEFDATMQTRPLTDAEAFAYLGDLLYHTNRLEEAEKYLQQALALAPELPQAHATLGMVRVRQRRFDEALPPLERSLAGDAQNYLAHYYLAEALNRRSIGPDGMISQYPRATAARMRAELQQAIALNPNFAEAHHLLAFLDMVNEEDLPAATGLLLRARQLKPGRHHYTITLAKVYMRREEFAAARNVLEQIMHSSNASGPEQAEARMTLQVVNNYAEQLAQIKAMGGNVQRRPAPDDDTDEATGTTTEQSLPPEALKPRLKRRAEGEQVRGVLTKIECVGGASVVLQVQTAAKLYKFHADQFDRVQLVAYVPDMAGTSITCGPFKQEMHVVLTYRAPTQPRPKYDGEIIAVDLITKDMEVEP